MEFHGAAPGTYTLDVSESVVRGGSIHFGRGASADIRIKEGEAAEVELHLRDLRGEKK